MALKTYLVTDRIKKFVSFINKGDKVLNIGANEGNLHKILKRASDDVYGLDIENTNYRKDKKFFIGDVVDMGKVFGKRYDGFFDVVVAGEVLEHTLNPIKALSEMHRVLKKGGKLILSVPNARTIRRYWNKLNKHEQHYFMWDLTTLRRILKLARFKVLEQGYVGSNVAFISSLGLLYLRKDLNWHIYTICKKI